MCNLSDFKVKFFILCCLLACIKNTEQTINERVIRTIDISSQLVKINSAITVNSNEEDYVVIINPDSENQLSFIGASSKTASNEKHFSVTEIEDNSSITKRKFKVHIGKQNIGRSLTFNLKTIYGRKLTPFPSEIKQSEKQYVKFIGNLYFYSPYVTEQQETQIITSNTNIVSYSQDIKPVSKRGNKIKYGLFRDQPAYSKELLVVHYENNSPFLVAKSLNRLIEISHWGNIAVEETIDLYHHGAKLKGPFSRFDYQQNQDGISSVRSFTTVFHPAAKDIYYRDGIGNISTSHLRELSNSVEIELRPRFPLFGGWKNLYTIGYNVPSYEFLYSKSSRFALKMRFIDHIFDNQLIDDATIKVVLPEKVSYISVKTPFVVHEGEREILKSYLDTSGRTVVVFTKKNLVEQHIQDFEIHYNFNRLLLVREPLMIIVAFCLLFVFIIVCVRLDFSIIKDERKEITLLEMYDKLCTIYQGHDNMIHKFKSTKDHEQFLKRRSALQADHLASYAKLVLSIYKLNGDSTDKVQKWQELDVMWTESIGQSIELAKKFVSDKIIKQDYLEAENMLKTKRKELVEKMGAIVSLFY